MINKTSNGMKKIFSSIATVAILSTPFWAMAETKDFKWLVSSIIDNFAKPATWLVMSLAVVFFLWNMMGIYKNSDNPEELAKVKKQAMWGIIAITVMVSMWGLVNFVTGSLKLKTSERINLERFNQPL